MLTVYCQCGHKLVRYKKGGSGRLIKIHKSRIAKDYCGAFINDYSKENTDIHCPACGERLATIKNVGGKFVNKLNQGVIWDIRSK